MKTLILFLILSTQTIAADLYLRNDSGKDLRVKINYDYENLKINNTLRHKLDNTSRSEIKVFYNSDVVTSTKINPSGRDSKLRIYIKDNAWFMETFR